MRQEYQIKGDSDAQVGSVLPELGLSICYTMNKLTKNNMSDNHKRDYALLWGGFLDFL